MKILIENLLSLLADEFTCWVVGPTVGCLDFEVIVGSVSDVAVETRQEVEKVLYSQSLTLATLCACLTTDLPLWLLELLELD